MLGFWGDGLMAYMRFVWAGWQQDHPEAYTRKNRARAAIALPGGVPRAPEEQRRQEGRSQGAWRDCRFEAAACWPQVWLCVGFLYSGDCDAHPLRCGQRSQGRILRLVFWVCQFVSAHLLLIEPILDMLSYLSKFAWSLLVSFSFVLFFDVYTSDTWISYMNSLHRNRFKRYIPIIHILVKHDMIKFEFNNSYCLFTCFYRQSLM